MARTPQGPRDPEQPAVAGAVEARVHTFPEPRDADASSGLTPRQRKVLEVIRDWVERFGYPPSVREIGDAVGLTSTSSVHHQLRTLEKKGYLRRDPNRTRARRRAAARGARRRRPGGAPRPRTCAPTAPRPRSSRCSADIAAGGPILAEQAVEDVFPLPQARSSARAPCSCSRCVGDSMIEAAITDGDWVVVRQQPWPRTARSSPR